MRSESKHQEEAKDRGCAPVLPGRLPRTSNSFSMILSMSMAAMIVTIGVRRTNKRRKLLLKSKEKRRRREEEKKDRRHCEYMSGGGELGKSGVE